MSISFALILASNIAGIIAISCHQCGNMYDGTGPRNFSNQSSKNLELEVNIIPTYPAFMAVENFTSCQFFEHDIAEDNHDFMVKCPDEDQCCFALREHMTVEFWGHAAAAEVLVRGCCSKLNKTKHHLASSQPPPLVLDSKFRAEILSQTVQSEFVKTRVLFCNTLGCNSRRIPWSKPITKSESNSMIAMSPDFFHTASEPEDTSDHTNNFVHVPNRRQTFQEEDNLLALIERLRTTPLKSNANLNQRQQQQPMQKGMSNSLNNDGANIFTLIEQLRSSSPTSNSPNSSNKLQRPNVKFTDENMQLRNEVFKSSDANNENEVSPTSSIVDIVSPRNELPVRCACNCNCPSLVCPSYQVSPNMATSNTMSIILILAIKFLFL